MKSPSRITKDLRSRATPQSSACTQANMICLRHPLTPAAAAGLVLAALLVPSIVASAPVDATTSSTLDSGTRAALDKALNEGFAASGMPGGHGWLVDSEPGKLSAVQECIGSRCG